MALGFRLILGTLLLLLLSCSDSSSTGAGDGAPSLDGGADGLGFADAATDAAIDAAADGPGNDGGTDGPTAGPPCDIDGDGHAAVDAPTGCVDAQGRPLPRDDPDDFDSAVFPGATVSSNGAEGGDAVMALRRYCSYTPDKNGLRQRDVDHDGDGQIAADDGCPAERCDVDGDGFAGSQCSPPAAELDCADEDATVFPGAPDKCGDGLQQDCVADVACGSVTDVDGDGYAAAVDCADDDEARHPWAVERCNGVDDDCDGLVDEGNPDASGQPIPTDVKRCNDDNDGQCGGGGSADDQVCTPGAENCSAAGRLLSGVCACSGVQPGSLRDDARRVACADEEFDAPVSPRCFGARQPLLERCDDEDWDCDGAVDDPEGAGLFVDRGKPCGTDRGNCKAGVVIGCDRSQQLPEAALIEAVLAAQSIEFNRYWVCAPTTGQSDFWLPTAEVCNGKDDDCDGEVPAGEQDGGDSDRYLPCSGCTSGSGRLDLLPSLAGCDDCAPGDDTVNPGAAELCNGVDDNCLNGLDDDGADECIGQEQCNGSDCV